jgi:hypothetical protein
MDNKELFALGALLISILGLLLNHFNRRNDDVDGIKRDVGTVKERLAKLEAYEVGPVKERLARIEAQFEYVSKKAAEVLHRPTHYELDQLLEKFGRNELGEDEKYYFVGLLEEVMEDKDTAPGYRGLAVLVAASVLGDELAKEAKKDKGASGNDS